MTLIFACFNFFVSHCPILPVQENISSNSNEVNPQENNIIGTTESVSGCYGSYINSKF